MAHPIQTRARPASKKAGPTRTAPHTPLDAIITVDTAGQVHSANNAVRSLFGWKPPELFGRDIRSILSPASPTLGDLLDPAGDAGTAATVEHPLLLEGLHKDGTAFPIELALSTAHVPGQPLPVIVILIRDARAKATGGPAERAERAERGRLLAAVTEQIAAINAAHLRMRQADRMSAIGTLAAGLGHDMNNVLLPMRAHINALSTQSCPLTGRDHLEAVQRSIGYLQQLSDDLHHLTLDPESYLGQPVTNLAHWWKDVGSLLAAAVPGDVTVTASLESSLPDVAIEPPRLTQAMLNLIVNAGEALSTPGETTGGKIPDKAVHVWAKADAASGRVKLGVTDNGPGMSPEVLRRTFELFFTTKTRRLGSGLGMSLARQLVAGAGGSVKVESKVATNIATKGGRPGGRRAVTGTTVTISLRTVPAERQPYSTERSSGGQPARRRAVVTLADGRVAAIVRLVLEASTPASPNRPVMEVVLGGGPGDADIWVTDATDSALTIAQSWSATNSARRVVLAGRPSVEHAAQWNELGAVVIDDVGHFQEIRMGLVRALAL